MGEPDWTLQVDRSKCIACGGWPSRLVRSSCLLLRFWSLPEEHGSDSTSRRLGNARAIVSRSHGGAVSVLDGFCQGDLWIGVDQVMAACDGGGSAAERWSARTD